MKGACLVQIFFFYLVSFFYFQDAKGQCLSTINAPFTEDFETTNGNWLPSSNTHWNWGIISPGTKQGITAASSGQHCWIAGSLQSTGYQAGTSYLTSPCYDISSLINPSLSCNIFWETENSWDGVYLEYTTDNGNTWKSLGSDASNNNCEATNWYNGSNIRYIGRVPGWSGSNITGDCARANGSGLWVTARFNLKNIAVPSLIQFRFVFGAGSQCNNYDGFAMDDFSVVEGSSSSGGFSYSCIGNTSIQFDANNSFCTTRVEWDFGDVNSADNTSNATNPTHQFSSPGKYRIKLIQHFSNAPDIITEKDVILLGVSLSITQTILCNANKIGAIASNVSGSMPPFQYQWSNNANTASISNLAAGNYSLTVTQANTCSATASINITEPAALKIDTTINNATCNQINGIIHTSISGGVTPYTLLWSNGASASSVTNLAYYKKYLLEVTDANLCKVRTDSIYIDNVIIPAKLNLGRDTTICVWQHLLLNPGNFSTYLWQNNSQNPTFLVKDSGKYYVRVVNEYGCFASDTIHVSFDCKGVVDFPNGFTPNDKNGNNQFGPVGDLSSITSFSIVIYNRWGQVVFRSSNPYQKWDGMYEGRKSNVETFIWTASYRIFQAPAIVRKGTIMALY